jgi:hypothetical protein
MLKLLIVLSLIPNLAFAVSANWQVYKTEDEFFSVELPCKTSNVLEKKDDNLVQKVYKCYLANATYTVTQVVYTKAGMKMLERHPSRIIDNTEISLMQKYKKEKMVFEVKKIFKKAPYNILNVIAAGNKTKAFTYIFDGPKALLIVNADGPESEDHLMKRFAESVKILD